MCMRKSWFGCGLVFIQPKFKRVFEVQLSLAKLLSCLSRTKNLVTLNLGLRGTFKAVDLTWIPA